MSGATVAAWRRRQEASSDAPPPPDDDQKRANGFQARTDAATIDSPDTNARDLDFVKSQQAGLAAAISLAKAATPSRPLPAVKSPASRPESPASTQGRAASAAPAQPELVIALPTPVIDRLSLPVCPAPVTPVSVLAGTPHTSRDRRAVWNSHSLAQIRWLPLTAILTAQAVLSLRLVWSNTAFPDEALYLWSGHLEWAHMLHRAPIPAFATFFSGSPAIYPPLGAIADSIGGLAGARLLSLSFMLGATVLLHGVARRLFDRRSAVFAAALFAGLSATQYLGAFATYDAMALLMLTFATWIGVRAVWCRPSVQLILMVAVASVLTLAAATKYATTLFDPVVIAVAGLPICRSSGRRQGVTAIITASCTLCLLLLLGIHFGGHAYWQGITTTTLTRASSTYPAPFLLLDSGKWVGSVAFLAIIGTVATACNRLGRVATVLAGILTTAVLLVPAEQVRIHTYTSLFKHVGFGGWFACIPAGYAVASLARAVPRPKAAHAIFVGVAAICLAAMPSIPWAASHFGWPDTSRVIPKMRAVLATTRGPVLADDRGNILEYYLASETAHRQILGTFFYAYNDPATGTHLTGAPAYAAAIHARYFSVIMLEFWDTAQTDDDILRDLEVNVGYQLIATIPYQATGQHGDVLIWVRRARR